MSDRERFFIGILLFLHLDWENPFQKKDKNKRYAYLVSENVGNFRPSKDSIVVFTHMHRLLLLHLLKQFPTTFTEDVA